MSLARAERPFRDLPTAALLAGREGARWDRADIASNPEDWEFPDGSAAYLAVVEAELAAELARRARLRGHPLAPPWPGRRAELDELKRRLGPVAAFERWTATTLRRAGRQHRARCPLHPGQADDDLAVDEEKGLWFCFGCLRGGDVFDLALALFDPPSFAAAVDLVALEAGVPRPGRGARSTGRGGRREGSMRVA